MLSCISSTRICSRVNIHCLGFSSYHLPSPYNSTLVLLPKLRPVYQFTKAFSRNLAMEGSKAGMVKDLPAGLDATMEEEYLLLSKLLQDFTSISSIEKAWTFKSKSGSGSQAMFLASQSNLLANKRRKFILSTSISKDGDKSVNFQWPPFPVEMKDVSAIVPSPSGSKLLVIRNPENESPTKFEIWVQYQLEKEFHIPNSIHGSVYNDGWFEGISWNFDETLIAYVAEEPAPSKPTFNGLGYKKAGSTDKDFNSWKGQGDWVEDWGETYAGKRQPALFVIDAASGAVEAVNGITKSLSVGQVVWAPFTEGLSQYLVFVGWPSDTRKLGMKYCYNRPCALYSVRAPQFSTEVNELEAKDSLAEDLTVNNLTQHMSSALSPCFSPDGRCLLFLSAQSSIDSGAHCSTNSLHRIDWSTDGKLSPSTNIIDVIPVIQCGEEGCFPGLYCSSLLSFPWLSDGQTMILQTIWGSREVILHVNVFSGEIFRASPADSDFSWHALALDGNNIIAVSSSPIDIPEVKYGCFVERANDERWSWSTVSSSIFSCSKNVRSLLSSLRFSITNIPVKGLSDCLKNGARKPYEAILVSSNKEAVSSEPLIVALHGGPHSVSVSSFSKSLAFLSALGYSVLIVNYRGSLGFGEEALQSLPGKIGSQDVNDVLAAIDYVIDTGLVRPSKMTVVGGSHGGFLTTHLIGQAPDKFVAAAARNPVCNIASMVGITDIPDWCYFETYGNDGKLKFTDAPSSEELTIFHNKSPISHISKVKTPTIFLLGAKDLRVPVSNGLQYARALKEKGVEVKVILFPEDVHGIERPQSDFESFLNIGVWFNKYCK